MTHLKGPGALTLASFLSGGWLEEYVYSLLQPLQHEGLIHDVRVGLEVGFRQVVAAKHEAPAQEFDCSFTDGVMSRDIGDT